MSNVNPIATTAVVIDKETNVDKSSNKLEKTVKGALNSAGDALALVGKLLGSTSAFKTISNTAVKYRQEIQTSKSSASDKAASKALKNEMKNSASALKEQLKRGAINEEFKNNFEKFSGLCDKAQQSGISLKSSYQDLLVDSKGACEQKYEDSVRNALSTIEKTKPNNFSFKSDQLQNERQNIAAFEKYGNPDKDDPALALINDYGEHFEQLRNNTNDKGEDPVQQARNHHQELLTNSHKATAALHAAEDKYAAKEAALTRQFDSKATVEGYNGSKMTAKEFRRAFDQYNSTRDLKASGLENFVPDDPKVTVQYLNDTLHDIGSAYDEFIYTKMEGLQAEVDAARAVSREQSQKLTDSNKHQHNLIKIKRDQLP